LVRLLRADLKEQPEPMALEPAGAPGQFRV
jgi:hypothetical protein